MSTPSRDTIPYHINPRKQLRAIATFRWRGPLTRTAKTTVHSERFTQPVLRHIPPTRRAIKRAQHLRNLQARQEAQRQRQVWPGIGRHANLSVLRSRKTHVPGGRRAQRRKEAE